MQLMRDTRGVTVVEVLVALLVTALVAGGGVALARSAAGASGGSHAAAGQAAASVAITRVMEELRSAVAILEARPDAVTAVVSTASGAAPLQYTDPATGQTVTLARYTVRYVFANGALYRDVGAQPPWVLAQGVGGGVALRLPVGAAPATPDVGFPGQEPQPPQPVADPGPPRYVRVYQGRTYETVFSGYWLTKSAVAGLATNRVWSQSEYVCTNYNRIEDSCVQWGWVTRYYTGGPLWISTSDYNAIASNPVRNSDGSIVGYRISAEIWATPAGMDALRSRPVYGSCGPQEVDCVVGYYVVGPSNELTASEYNATTGSPATVQRFTDVYTEEIDPEWQAQYDAYQQYQIDYQNWQNAHATWEQRYTAWSTYYRAYGSWAAEVAMINALAAYSPLLTAPPGRTLPSPWQPAGGAQLSGSAQIVARLSQLQFAYTDRTGAATTVPDRVAMITVSYTGGDGTTSSAAAAIGGTAASGTRARVVSIPSPCEADPRNCPPPPPQGDPVRDDYERAVGSRDPYRTPDWWGMRLWSDGEVTFIHCGGDGCRVVDQATYEQGVARVQSGAPNSGFVVTYENGSGTWRSDATYNNEQGESRSSSSTWASPDW